MHNLYLGKIWQEISTQFIGMYVAAWEDNRGVRHYAMGVVDDFGFFVEVAA